MEGKEDLQMARRTENIIHFGAESPPVAAPVVAPEGVAVAGETPVSTEGKKKRGRPRKYGPDGALALSPMPISASIPLTGGEYPTWKTKKEKPIDLYMKKHRMEYGSPQGEREAYTAGANFTPHIITVNAGEDVSMKIMSFSQQGSRAICILAANGAVSNVTLRQPNSSGGTLTYEGRFEILSLSGSFRPTDSGGAKSITGGMSVSLAGPDGRVMGGGLAGLLVAAGPVQVVIGSFIPGYQQEQKPKKQRSEFAPTISPIPAANHVYAGSTDAIYTGTMRSITPASYHGINGSAGNFVNGPTTVAAENNISLPREGHPVVAAENSISMAGDGQTVVAAENNISKPGESEKLSPSNCMVSC